MIVGCHMNGPTNEAIHNTMCIALQIGGNALQCNLSPGDRPFQAKPISKEVTEQILSLCAQTGFYIVVHGKYMYNLSRPDTGQYVWQLKTLVEEIKIADTINADIVIHQGKNVAVMKISHEEALDNYVQNIGKALDKTNSCHNSILLENSCRQGTEMGYSLVELADIYHRFTDTQKKRIGFCIDLCHVFVAGELDVRSGSAVKSYLEQFDKLIGLDKLKLIHFNDSNVRLDGHNDSHHNILMGHIGNHLASGSSEGFREICRFAVDNNVPMILETGKNYMDEIRLLRSWESSNYQISEYERSFMEKHSAEIKEDSIKINSGIAPRSHSRKKNTGPRPLATTGTFTKIKLNIKPRKT